MNILLVSSNTASSPYPVYPLGMSMIASAAHNAGHCVSVFDFMQAGKSFNALEKTLSVGKPDVVGVSIRNIDNVNMMHEERYIDQVKDIVDCIRAHSAAKVVLGGPAFSILPQAIMRITGADYGVVGEGERVFVRLLKKGERGEWPLAGKVLYGDEPLGSEAIPSALYDEELMATYLERGSIASVQTKRGCPLRCVYCSYPALEGPYIRARDPEHVVQDIEDLKESHGANYLFFTDSVFNDDAGSFLDVLHQMKTRNVNIKWSAFFKPSGITPQNVHLMAETGLQAAELGSDAACNTTLEGQRKSFTWQDVVRANDIFREADIAAAHYFMFGGPGETKETVLEGIENIKALSCSAAFVFMGIRILPDTELYDIALREKFLSEEDDLIQPAYYISPEVERDWLEKTLTRAFKPIRHVLFPPDILDDKLQLLHKLGHSGSLWDLLGGGKPAQSGP